MSVRHLLPLVGLSESAQHSLGAESISYRNTSRQDSEKQLRTAGLGALSTLTTAEMKLPPATALLSLCRHLDPQFWLPGNWASGRKRK